MLTQGEEECDGSNLRNPLKESLICANHGPIGRGFLVTYFKVLLVTSLTYQKL